MRHFKTAFTDGKWQMPGPGVEYANIEEARRAAQRVRLVIIEEDDLYDVRQFLKVAVVLTFIVGALTMLLSGSGG